MRRLIVQMETEVRRALGREGGDSGTLPLRGAYLEGTEITRAQIIRSTQAAHMLKILKLSNAFRLKGYLYLWD